MLRKRLRHCKNAGAGPQLDALSRPGAGPRGQHPVEPAKAFGRNHAVALRHGIKRWIELATQIEPASDMAKADDLGSYRNSSEELRALQRLGLLRQRGEATVDAAFPLTRGPRDRPPRLTAQVAQRQ